MSDTIPDDSRDDLIIWSVIEEHFDEAAFVFGAWQDALFAPNYTLEEVEKRLEGRLEANLEGLEVGGVPVAHKMLIPALTEATDSGYAAAAALTMLRSGSAQNRDILLDATAKTEGAQQAGLVSALVAAETEGLDDGLIQRFVDAKSDEEKALWLSILNERRIYPGSRNLQPYLESKNDALLAAAVRSLNYRLRPEMSRRPEYRSRYEPFVLKHFQATSAEVQDAVVELGLLIGLKEARYKCLDLAKNPGPNQKRCMEVAALLFPQDAVPLLSMHLGVPEVGEQALFCLGLTGTIAAGEYCLPFLENEEPRLAKLAAEALASIAGLDMEENAFQRDEEPSEDEALLTGIEDDPPVVDPVESLNLPSPDAVKQWWMDHRTDFSFSKRYIRGELLNAASLLKLFETGPMRLRGPMAYWMWIKTGGGRSLATCAFSQRQRRELQNLHSLHDNEFLNDL